MILTVESKRAIRRLQADKLFTKRQLAEYVGISEKTAQKLTRDEKPQEVKNIVFQKVMSAIAANY